MIWRIIVTLILALTITSCGPAATAAPTEAPAATKPPATEPAVEQPLGAVDTQSPFSSAEPEQSPIPASTATQTPAATNTAIATLTETQLPPLELPTEAANAPAQLVWDGTPTYLGDSQPGPSTTRS